MNKVISVVAMCAGSFLLGGSLGLALSSYSCKLCMTEGDIKRISDKILEEMIEDEEGSEEIVHCPKCGSEHADMVSLIRCEDCVEDKSLIAYNYRNGETAAIGQNKYYNRENIEQTLDEDPQDRMRYNRETGEYEPFEADEEVISTVEDLVQSYISKDDERPELDEEDGEDTDKEERYSGQSNELSQDLTSGESEETERDGGTNIEISEEPMTDDEEDSGDIIIVSTDSYLNEYKDYDKNTLTYYAGDDILTDSRDEIIFDQENYVGPEALDMFGEGSDDENVVYVRNFKKKADYEIIRDSGTFRESVLGYTSEYKLVKKKNLDKEESEE